ncbi:MAG TPA: MarR family transcriptional regulator [Chitinophagales bacterium]|nr:MarR family transcriptional regulator [Chitinophagales bacterium]
MSSIGEEIHQKEFKSVYVKTEVNILFTAGWIENNNNKFFKLYDISMQQFNVLRILRGQYPQPVMLSLITERMIDKMSNATRLVEKLRIKGYVSRELNTSNRRQVDILITESGLELLAQIDLNFSGLEDKYKKLSLEEAEILNQLLDKLRGEENVHPI